MREEQPNRPDGGRRVRFVSAWPAPEEPDHTDEQPTSANEAAGGAGQEAPRRRAPANDGTDDTISAFPGGRVRLPRIEEARRRRMAQDAAEESTVRFVGTAFVRPRRESDASERVENHSGFSEYYTYESLFDAPPVEEVAPVTADDKALAALGLASDAIWSEVVAAHRQLVKETHPDLLVGADPATIEAATERLRAINLAYTQLKAARRTES